MVLKYLKPGIKSRFMFILFFLLISTGSVWGQKVKVISTTETVRWKEWKQSKTTSATSDNVKAITVYPDSVCQLVDGFGGTFNELGWDALQELAPAQQAEVMNALFGKEGIHFPMARTPIGASDYALSYYSYCDVKGDFTMRDFSVARDKYILIPYIKEALKLRPDLKLWASPWTPPAWMKINEHYTLKAGDIAGRTGGNEMDEKKNVSGNVTAFNMQQSYLKAYALYFSKYVQEYEKAGVPIWAIMPQNEIAWSPNWPCCTWRAEDMAYFIGKFLGPQFNADHINAEIWLGTINYPNPDYVRRALVTEGASEYIKGIGFQWSGSQALPAIRKEYPQYGYMQTENTCGEHENDWSSLENTWRTVVYYFAHGAHSYMYWNMILDETGKSAWGWPQNSLVIIDRNSKEVAYTDEFYLMKHLSHFIQPQSRLLKTSDTDNTLAFRTIDNKTVLITYNPDKEKQLVVHLGNNITTRVVIPGKSINTIVINQ